jgi:hypothetical protein
VVLFSIHPHFIEYTAKWGTWSYEQLQTYLKSQKLTQFHAYSSGLNSTWTNIEDRRFTTQTELIAVLRSNNLHFKRLLANKKVHDGLCTWKRILRVRMVHFLSSQIKIGAVW